MGTVFLAHTASSISVASTPAPYTASSPSNDYASPTPAESVTPDYNNKYNNPHNPYSRQVYDPMTPYNPPNNHLVEGFTPYSSLLSPRPFLFHRVPSIFNSPAHSGPVNPESTGYPSSYNPSSYPTQSGFVPSTPLYEPQYPFAYSKYPKNAYVPSCDYQLLSPYRHSKPLLFFPQKPENFYDYPSAPAKQSDPLYRYQPAAPAYGNSYASNLPVYH